MPPLDPLDASPDEDLVGADGEGMVPAIVERDSSARELEGAKDVVTVWGALGEVEGDLSAKELEGRKGAVPVGGVLGESTCVSLGDYQGLTHGTLHNDEAATRLRQLVTHGESVVETGIVILVSGAVSTVDAAC
ncbi:hypothetical protein B0H13DRAFT_1857217 [Mycena leptocephala]|nr:hypothetical protein B0H13DRAFT_1857217 [Mycena leptocephala]